MGTGWTVAGALAGADRALVADAIAGCEAGLAPLVEADPALGDPERRGAAARAICTALKATGAKLAPHLSPDQASAWLDGVLLSIARWPPAAALGAARAVVHERFPYGLGDVDAKLHELAAAIDRRHREALFRLRRLRDELDRAASPVAPALAPPDPGPPTLEEARRWSPQLLAFALRAGFIAPELHALASAPSSHPSGGKEIPPRGGGEERGGGAPPPSEAVASASTSRIPSETCHD